MFGRGKQTHRDRVAEAGARGWAGMEEWEGMAKGDRVSLCSDEKALKLTVVMFEPFGEYIKKTEFYTLGE